MVILIPIMRSWNLEMTSTSVLIYLVVLKHDVVGGILGDFTLRNITADPGRPNTQNSSVSLNVVARVSSSISEGKVTQFSAYNIMFKHHGTG